MNPGLICEISPQTLAALADGFRGVQLRTMLRILAAQAAQGYATEDSVAHLFRRPSDLRWTLQVLVDQLFLSHDRELGRYYVRIANLPVRGLVAPQPSLPMEEGLPAALASLPAPMAPDPSRALFARLPAREMRAPAPHVPCDHLVHESCSSQVPSDQLTGAAPEKRAERPDQFPPARGARSNEVLCWLARTSDTHDWNQWAGWWQVVNRNNPERIEAAWGKFCATQGIRKPAAWMRQRINEMRDGLG